MKARFRGIHYLSFFFFLQIKSFVIHIKIYYLGFLSVIDHTRVGVEKRMEDKHKDFQKKGKNSDFKHVVHFEFIVQQQAKKSVFCRHKHGITRTFITFSGLHGTCPRSQKGHISI